MAEDIRRQDTGESDIAARELAEISAEAYRQMENCLYTSTMLYMWLRAVRIQHRIVIALPIILTAIAGFSLAKEWLPDWAVALIAFAGTLIPPLARALNIETHVEAIKSAAAEFKALQDRFRQLMKIISLHDVRRARDELSQLMDRMDVVRSTSLTPPERYFKRASEKIKRGDYDFTTDIVMREALEAGSVKPLPKYD